MEYTNINRYIRIVLLAGMLSSVVTMIIGLLMFAFSEGPWDNVPLSLSGIIEGIGQGNPIAVIDLGILMLIATPLTRVITALVVFAFGRETKFVMVALVVLAVVTIAVFAGG